MVRVWVVKVIVLLSPFLVGTAVLAQEDTCPTIVEAALDATDEQCSLTERNEACYGNVNLEATPKLGVENFTFGVPGDIVSVGAVERLTLSSRVEEQGEWGVALMQLQANLPDTLPGQNVTFLMFGAVEVTNAVADNIDPVEFTATAQGNTTVYSEPSTESTPAATLAAGGPVTVDGRSADGLWLRVSDAQFTGWVSAEAVAADGDTAMLTIVGASGLPFSPMQAFYFKSGVGDAPCAAAPDSGILVQTPEGVEEIQFAANQVNITLGSTAFMQAQPDDAMTVSVIEGEAVVGADGVSVTVPEGSMVRIPLDAQGLAAGEPDQPEPYDGVKMGVLPVRILPRTITIAEPIIAESTADGTIPAAGEWQWTTGAASQEGCPAGVLALIVPGFTPAGPFRLPGDAFSLSVLFGAAFGEPDAPPNAVFSNPDASTYVVEFSDGTMEARYEVTVIDSDHIEGQMASSGDGCSITIPFTVERAGD